MQKNSIVSFFSAEDLCELLPKSNARPPRFYRVSQRDESSFSPTTFKSLVLDRVEVQSKSLQVFWNIQLDYYYTDYDWGLIYRQIGSEKLEQNMFFQTRYNLKHHLETHPNWSPKSENLTAEIGGLKPDTFYEICLAVVEHDTVYYVHRDLCSEIETLEEITEPMIEMPKAQISTRNVSVVPHKNSVTLTWNIAIEDPNVEASEDIISVIRQISVRRFGSTNATQLFVLEDFNRTVLQKEADSAR